jgi:hypothetical protein
MYRPFLLALALCGLPCAFLAAKQAEGEKPAVKVLTLEMRKQAPPGIDPSIGDYSTSTTMLVMLSLPDKQILAIDAKASSLESMTDDKSTDLTKPDKKNLYPRKWLDDFSMARVSKDKKHCSIHVFFPAVPAEGAMKLTLKAKFVVLCGAEEKNAEGKNVELKDGKSTKVGSVIVSYNKNNSFGNNTAVSIICEDAPRIKSVTFLDKDGQALKTNDYNYLSRNTAGGRNDWISNYTIDGKVDQATVRIIYYDKLESVTVPAELQVGVGF